jgi:tripartite-type tricarboxylate transporter receptor subunit TctC
MGLAALILISALASALAATDAVSQFYKGKTISIVVGFNVGGGYDGYARLVAQYWGKYIPGNPSIIVRNMPGAGGLIAGNYFAHKAVKDGTEIGMISGASAVVPLVGGSPVSFDPRDFIWLGSPTVETGVCLSSQSAPVKTIDDVKTTQIITGAASGETSNTYTYPHIINEALGTKFKIVAGYGGVSGLMRAIEAGEIEAFCGNVYATIRTRYPAWLQDGKVRILVQMALRKDPSLPDVPLIMDLVGAGKDFQVFRLLVGSQSLLGRPFFAPPGVAASKTDALRQAFDATMKDSDFLAQAAKSRLAIEPVTGKDIQDYLAEMYALPKAVIEEADRMVGQDTPYKN